jgi:hypothetical protein
MTTQPSNHVDQQGVIWNQNASAAFSAINPGITVSAVVPFQLSTSDSIKQLVLHDSAFSGGVTVNVG